MGETFPANASNSVCIEEIAEIVKVIHSFLLPDIPFGQYTDEVKHTVEFIFAAMTDALIYQWLKANCYGCEMNWCSQRDHACLNYGDIENFNESYFKDIHPFILDDWIIGASLACLDQEKTHEDIKALKSMITDIRRRWTYTPHLSRDAMELSKLSTAVSHELKELALYWLGDVDFTNFEISCSL